MAKKSTASDFPNLLRPYWRYEYVKVAPAGNPADPFEGIEQAPDAERLVVARGKVCCLLLNRFPYCSGHLLAIPYRAVANLEDLTAQENAELHHFIVLGKQLLTQVMHPVAFNIGINQGEGKVSGGSVPNHLHWHIVPRWWGDNSYLPIIGGPRILVRSLTELHKAMVKAYKGRSKAAAKPQKRKRA